jgi:Xaa-Pro aminopeptidase
MAAKTGRKSPRARRSASSLSSASSARLTEAVVSRREYRKKGVHLEKDIAGDLTFSREEYLRRYDKIRAAMDRRGLVCLVITGNTGWFNGEQANLRYITGLDVWLEPLFAVFPLEGDPVVFYKGGIFSQRTMRSAAPVAFESTPLKPGTGNAAYFEPFVAKKVKELGLDGKVVGLAVERIFPVNALRELKKEVPHATLVDANDLMNEVRLVKSAEEINFLRRSGYCADKAMEALIDAVRPGVTERELYLAADNAAVLAGCSPGGFQLVGSGRWPNLGLLSLGTHRKLQKGDVFLNELTAFYKGYCTQLAVPVWLGTEPAKDFLEFIEVNRAMYRAQLDAFRPGVAVAEVDKLGEKIAAEMSGGKLGSHFACQTIDFERSFEHPAVVLEPGIGIILMPWIHHTEPGKFVGHGLGNTIVCTEGEPLVLNKSRQCIVTVS